MIARAALALVLTIPAAGCGDAPVAIEFAKVCRPENDGKTVATEGFLRAPFAMICRTTKRRFASTTTCAYDLRESAAGGGRLSVNVATGGGANQADETRAKERRGVAAIKASDGRFLGEADRVRVSGFLRAVPDSLKQGETICWLEIETIERR